MQNEKLYNLFKRLTDIFGATMLGAIFLFLLPFIAFAIKFEDKGPIFHKQKRVGKNNKIFIMFKFRTMVIDAESLGPEFTEKNDRRIIKFGKFLRNSRLDELPQIINIFKGEMSFVGPRPDVIELYKRLAIKIRGYEKRLTVKPGLTGLAQASQKILPYSTDDFKERLHYDLYYIKNKSFIFDIIIIFKTTKAIFKIHPEN